MEANQNQSGFNSDKKPLPNAKTPLTLGIISIVGVICCCVPFLNLAMPLIMAILGFIGRKNATKSLALYDADPNSFDEKSVKSVKTGKTLSTIGMVLGLILLVVLIYLLTFGEDQMLQLQDWAEEQQRQLQP